MDNRQNHIVFFDGVCSLCQAWVRFLIKRDKSKKFYFSSLQSEFAQSMIPDSGLSSSIDSIIYYSNGKFSIKSSAALKILRDLGGLWTIPAVLFLIPVFIRDGIYDIIARNRYKWFGKSNQSCELLNEDELVRVLH
ncbi:MAG: DUF393 domain-containing protein [Saprospiraceae bacterium]|nr:DUF393 domain-containing protein [Saprospiraceae bacterium]